MRKLKIFCVVLLVCLIGLCGCSNSDNDELQKQMEELQKQNEELKTRLEQMEQTADTTVIPTLSPTPISTPEPTTTSTPTPEPTATVTVEPTEVPIDNVKVQFFMQDLTVGDKGVESHLLVFTNGYKVTEDFSCSFSYDTNLLDVETDELIFVSKGVYKLPFQIIGIQSGNTDLVATIGGTNVSDSMSVNVALSTPIPVNEIIHIYDVRIYVNSVGGVSTYITWENKSEKDIKYITFSCRLYNRVDDSLKCEITGKRVGNLEQTGPIPQGKGMYNPYSITTGAYEKYASDAVLGKIPYEVYKEDEKNGWVGEYWSNVWYNSSAEYVKIDAIEIIYMDGTTLEITDKETIEEAMQSSR